MLRIAVLICCVVVCLKAAEIPVPITNSDGSKIRRTYVLEQHCPSEPAILDFHDEVMVKSQVGSSYRTNVSCAMSLKPAKEELGLIAVALFGETASHTDRMEMKSTELPPFRFFGPDREQKLTFATYGSDTVTIEWNVPENREARIQERGFAVVLTAYLMTCPPGMSCFRCDHGIMLHNATRCDGWNNCGDDSDERNCQ